MRKYWVLLSDSYKAEAGHSVIQRDFWLRSIVIILLRLNFWIFRFHKNLRNFPTFLKDKEIKY